MSKPTVFTLAGDAKNFVFANLDALKNQAMLLFPMVLVLEFLNSLGRGYDMRWIEALTAIPLILVYACFALSWHRTSLMGPGVSQPVNPFSLEKRDWGFIGVFFGFIFLPFLVGLLYGVVVGIMVGIADRTVGKAVSVIIVLIAIPIFIWGLITLIRLSFLLPARSVGVKLTFAEARRSSKGVLWPLIGTGMVFALMYIIPLLIYGMIVAAIVGVGAMASGAENVTTPSMALVQFIISVPILAVNFLITALNITALSRAYQWGIKNNPIEPAA